MVFMQRSSSWPKLMPVSSALLGWALNGASWFCPSSLRRIGAAVASMGAPLLFENPTLSSRHEPALGTPFPEPLLKGIWFATKKEEEVDCGGGLNTGPGPRLAAQAPPPVLHAIRSRSRRTSVLPQRRTV